MRVGPVRVTKYNERAVAQVDIRKIPHASLFRLYVRRCLDIIEC